MFVVLPFQSSVGIRHVTVRAHHILSVEPGAFTRLSPAGPVLVSGCRVMLFGHPGFTEVSAVADVVIDAWIEGLRAHDASLVSFTRVEPAP